MPSGPDAAPMPPTSDCVAFAKFGQLSLASGTPSPSPSGALKPETASRSAPAAHCAGGALPS